MRQRVWIIRFISVLIVTIISLLISLILNNSYMTNYLNTTFIIGLLFLMFSSLSYVIISGFFRVFSIGFKTVFYREDTSIDRSHWSYDKHNTTDNDQKELMRDAAKKELFIYLPFIIGFVLVLQSIIILTLIK